MTHRDSMALHAIRRVWQRWGFAMTRAEYAELCADVGSRLDQAIPGAHHGRVFVWVTYRDTRMVAIWDIEHGCICTFVPRIEKARLVDRAAA